ncbi:MAG: hypothetical protein AB2A00_18385 [Myxococcota bacterium]
MRHAACSCGQCVAPTQLSLGDAHSCARMSNGSVWCWGTDVDGRSGRAAGTLADGVAHQVRAANGQAMTGFVEVAAGGSFTCARRHDGTVWCWGANDSGQLGVAGSGTHRPVMVEGIQDATTLVAGGAHACAVLSDDTVVCWGENGSGQLANGGADRPTPVGVDGVTGVVDIVSGDAHTCVVLSGGGVKCWGAADDRLGTPTPSQGTVEDVVGVNNPLAISARGRHTCVIGAGDEVPFCWGHNDSGQLGADVAAASTYSATKVNGVGSTLVLASGGGHNCALIINNTVMCWGLADNGELGEGHSGVQATPRLVSGVTAPSALAAGGHHTCALVAGNQVKCWGDDEVGQCGDGAPTSGADGQIDTVVWEP